jgi:hypothetical protein
LAKERTSAEPAPGPPVGYKPAQLLHWLQSTLLDVTAQHKEKFQLNLLRSYVALWEEVDALKLASGDAFLKWDAFREKIRPQAGAGREENLGFKSKENLKEAVRLLHELGVLLWYDNRPDCEELADRVFIRPEWVVDLLKPIVGHELQRQYLRISEAKLGPAWVGKSPEQMEAYRNELIR